MINKFDNEYAFLSNFYEHEFEYLGLVFSTAEHAYQAVKAKNPYDMLWVKESKTPGVAKRRGRKVELKPNWDQDRIGVMLLIVNAKFKDAKLKNKLILTNQQKLVEGNYWHDQFWGNCMCPTHEDTASSNYLGKILMYVRKNHQQLPIG